jgi:hypothetical protein
MRNPAEATLCYPILETDSIQPGIETHLGVFLPPTLFRPAAFPLG